MPPSLPSTEPRRLSRWLRRPWIRALVLAICGLLTARGTRAENPPCRPCAGLRFEQPESLVPQLEAAPRLPAGARFYAAVDVPLDDTSGLADPGPLQAAGATPWLRLVFTAPPPLRDHLTELEQDLQAASEVAAATGEGTHFQILWRSPTTVGQELRTADYAFLLKRAAVAISGARPGARIISEPLAPVPATLAALYAEEIAAYLDGVALAPAEDATLEAAVDRLAELDPGKPLVLDGVPYPEPPEESLFLAARYSVNGFAVVLFRAPTGATPSIAPLKLLAREFQGDLSFDPFSTPTGPEGVAAWSFVRGEDLGLRVIVRHTADAEEVRVLFSDPQLRRPARVDPATGDALDMYSGLRTPEGFELRWQPSGTVTVLRLDRPGAEEIAGIAGLEEEVTVISERQLPVEEILRRLQAVEDAQRRRLRQYRAVNTTHLRFQFGTEGIEVTFQGELFFRQQQGYDWAWQRFFINGLRWRGKKLPKIPLIEPGRAANLPLEILFTRDYRYRLRGTAVVAGRDCWVVDFQPRALQPGESLFRGTVWIDRELYTRVQSRAVQLGLEGDVVSNEETIFYTPVDARGQATDWTSDSIWLPLRVVSQQIWSLFNTSTVVEKETLLSELVINDTGFEERRQELLSSKTTMLRDTDDGLRYLVPDKQTGGRVVQEKFNTNRLFFAGGVFYDESLDYPLPLLGVDYFSLDFQGTGSQLNVFFGGALLSANFATPHLLDSRFDAGVDLFAIAVRGTDTLYRDNREVPGEEVEQRQANLRFNLGRQLGSYSKLDLSYDLRHSDYARSDETAEAFVLPVDHLTHTLRLGGSYSRAGYRVRLNGRFSKRSDWQPWGLPDSGEFDPTTDEYLRWDATLAKTFYLKGFTRAGIELQYVDGDSLDRFSKYDLGFFSDVRVRGYESNRVRAERATALHASYGFEMNELLRLQVLGDGAWATDRASGLEQEFLAGVGVAGTVVGPWQTLIRLDLGAAVAGPDDGISVFLTFLKLYK